MAEAIHTTLRSSAGCNGDELITPIKPSITINDSGINSQLNHDQMRSVLGSSSGRKLNSSFAAIVLTTFRAGMSELRICEPSLGSPQKGQNAIDVPIIS